MSPQTELEVSIRLLVALLLGAAIGVEREYTHHSAGLRTMAAVSLGSCLFTVVGLYPHGTDPTRIAAQVVSGVGFLGAGAILRSGISVRGLTTAATIWVVAAIGMAVGFGLIILPAVATILMLVFLILLKPIEDRLFRNHLPEAVVEPAPDPTP